MQTVIVPGPQLTPEQALRYLADEPDLVCLYGGTEGGSLLTWGQPERPAAQPNDLPLLTTGHAQTCANGWPEDITGGILLQADYEWPVGPWAHGLPHRPQNRASAHWRPVLTGLRWDRQGCCEIVAENTTQAETIAQRFAAPLPAPIPPTRATAAPRPAWTATDHSAKVHHILDQIAAGDCYQVNLTLPFHCQLAPGEARDLALFLHVIAEAPGGHAALWRSAERSVISHSPETFLASTRQRTLVSLPIKGTRRRIPGAEAKHRAELQAHAKDNAELAMIVDMVRNDLGRIAEPGSVRVPERPEVIDLAYVHHLVAAVHAVPRPLTSHADLLAATFPAASITGAPKVAAMQIIDQLEVKPRGAYCGTIGWLGADGACSLSVAIRTAQLSGDQLRIDAGGGIVADSNPAAEWDEVLAKAAPLCTAVSPC